MVQLEYQLIIAFLLDLLCGDPRWLPHPVKIIGRLALFLEDPCRGLMKRDRPAGVLVVVLVLFATCTAVSLLVWVAGLIHPWLADAVSILLLYTSLAARDLAGHATDVYRSLQAGDLPEAREMVGRLVGRDTEHLDEGEISRAAIESVAENTSDGVTAPLFYALLAGPLGAILYKAINTLDSSFGYKNKRYLHFGWASARLDDAANYLPARLTALLIPMAAALLRFRPALSWKILWRDSGKHPSPNSGLTEAAVAGALGIQLGGLNSYFGSPSLRPTMGDPEKPIERGDIPRACSLMYVTVVLFLLLGLAARRWLG